MPLVRKRLRSAFRTPTGSPEKKTSHSTPRKVLHSPRTPARVISTQSISSRNSPKTPEKVIRNSNKQITKRSHHVETSTTPRSPSSAHNSTPAKKKKISRNPRKAIFSTSPRKTRALQKREDDSGDDEMDCKCEACGQARPLDQLQNCPSCLSIFHMTCLQLEQETLHYFNANQQKWQCPRCINCSKCSEYIYDPGNIQCLICGKAYHGACRPKKSTQPEYPYSRWVCEKCEAKSPSNLLRTPLTSPDGKENRLRNNLTGSCPNSLKKRLDGSLNPKRKVKVTVSRLPNDAIKTELEAFDATEERLLENMRYWDMPDLREGNEHAKVRSKKQMKSPQSVQSPHKHLKNFLETPKSSKRPTHTPRATESPFEVDEKSMNKDDLILQAKLRELNQNRNTCNEWLYFGQYLRFKPIYKSSYPEPIQSSKVIYLCEFCLRPLVNVHQFKNHIAFCPWKHPPGNEIYREQDINVWEIEGTNETVYCRNLCLLAKLFLSSKTLYHEVETFTFYILTEITPRGCTFAGYFSKEKNPSKNNNLSCLLTLPSSQGKGYGKLLIDLSYNLSKKEHKIGSPEHPLSDMGLLAYRSYWKSAIISTLRKRRNAHIISIKDLSVETAIHHCDIISTLLASGMLLFRNDNFYILTNQAFNASLRSLRRRTINPDFLHWQPAFDVSIHNKMNSYSADS